MPIQNKIIAGDTIAWVELPFTNSLGFITSANWRFVYSLRGSLPAGNVDLTGTAAGGGWSFSLSSAQSAALNTGASRLTWYWQAWAQSLDQQQRCTVGNGQLFVSPNLAAMAASAAFDGRSQAEQIYAAINKEIQARVDGGVSVEYSIGNRSLKREPTAELLKLRSHYLTIISNERRAQQLAAGQGNSGRVGVRFK
jgi:hypothetical protein